jgi:hypothetical protein
MGPPKEIQDLQDTEQSSATTKGISSTSSLEILGTTPTTLQKYGDFSVVYKWPKSRSFPHHCRR